MCVQLLFICIPHNRHKLVQPLTHVVYMYSGMPYPKNFETAKEVEVIVRMNGAVPATIAILDGIPCVGVYI